MKHGFKITNMVHLGKIRVLRPCCCVCVTCCAMTLRVTGLVHMSNRVNFGVMYQRGAVIHATISTRATKQPGRDLNRRTPGHDACSSHLLLRHNGICLSRTKLRVLDVLSILRITVVCALLFVGARARTVVRIESKGVKRIVEMSSAGYWRRG